MTHEKDAKRSGEAWRVAGLVAVVVISLVAITAFAARHIDPPLNFANYIDPHSGGCVISDSQEIWCPLFSNGDSNVIDFTYDRKSNWKGCVGCWDIGPTFHVTDAQMRCLRALSRQGDQDAHLLYWEWNDCDQRTRRLWNSFRMGSRQIYDGLRTLVPLSGYWTSWPSRGHR